MPICRLCGHHASLDRLIAPCLCAKRDDTLLCHAECLLQHIEASLHHRIDSSGQEAATCPTCGQPYHVKLRYRLHFTAAKALSAVSLDQYCHLLGLCLMLVLLLFTAWATLHPHHKHTTALTLAQDAAEEPAHPHQQQHVGGAGVTAWAVAVIVVMVLVLTIVAAAQMLVRLRRHQTEVELVDDMMV